ncbi:type II toxin-antitoxin system MqsR family toxin [Boseongicola sp. H5]|uniref:type II toxin-antitoxin system MqsR family toxin n=1 Tax=Boseongicola sp. H5 TaxID=2763261 RepID=UPI001AFE970D|nr:type II toxin-antitoxin system MqsR family toxin [Roseicyclus sp.]
MEAIKSTFSSAKSLNATGSAIRSTTKLGFGSAEIVEVIQSIDRRDFQKSMTSYADHRVWQGVYYAPSGVGELYVKFRADVVSGFLLFSFKEKDNG